MKKIVVAAFAALVAFGASAMYDDAHTANHKWVRKYVAELLGKRVIDAETKTNANGTVTITSPFASTNIPGAVSISMTFSANTNEALRVDNSTIPGMTNRTYYAYDYAQCGYMNTNAPVRAIYASKVVNTSVVTNYYTGEFSNHYWVVTNRVTETRFSATGTNGTAFVSFKTNGVYWIQAATNAAWKAKITRTKVSDANRSQLIGTPLAKTGRRFSLFDLLVPTAYADAPSGNGIADDGTVTWSFNIDKITLTYEHGATKDIDISALRFEFNDALPEKPDPAHTCSLNSDCYCEGYGLTPSDIENNAAYDASQYEEAFVVLSDFSAWMTEDQWKASGGKISKKGNWTIWTEDGKDCITPGDITGSDAWASKIGELVNAIKDYLAECQENYKKSIICDSTEEMPCHDWYTRTCGAYIWKVCRRNPSHKEGTEQHEWNTTVSSYDSASHYFTCKGIDHQKKKSEGHTVSGGSGKQYQYDANNHITGWKIYGGKCTVSGCGYSTPTVDHTCAHHYCHSCEGGDDCNLPCQHCNGNHDYSAATSSKCARCKCPGCGVCKTLQGSVSGTPQCNTEDHGGFHDCGEHDVETENEMSGRGHCVCACGYNGCATSLGTFLHKYGITSGARAECSHVRDDLAAPLYEDCNDGVNHWEKTKSKCKNPGCEADYGAKNPHEYNDGADESQVGKATYVDNENCAWKKTCKKTGCGHKTTEANHPHVATSDGMVGHDFVDNGSGRQCRHKFFCVNCLGDFYEYYNLTEDECGNKRCPSGHLDGTKAHKDWTDDGNANYDGTGGTHTCACGDKTEGHTYGDWEKVSESGGKINWKRVCNKCGHQQAATTDEDKAPSDIGEEPSVIGGHCGNWTVESYVSTNETATEVWGGGWRTNWVWKPGALSIGGSWQREAKWFPTGHCFAWNDGTPVCMVCTNVNPVTSDMCATNGTEEAQHGGWHDVQGLCVCGCAFMKLAHNAEVFSNIWTSAAHTNAQNAVETNCYKVCYCGRTSEKDDSICGTVTNVLDSHAWEDEHVYMAVVEGGFTNCHMKQICKHKSVAGHVFKDGSGNVMCGLHRTQCREHYYLPTGNLLPDVENGTTNSMHHIIEKKCQHSEIWTDYATGEVVEEEGCGTLSHAQTEPHTMTDWEYAGTYDDAQHKMASECWSEIVSNGCGYVQFTNQAHVVVTNGPMCVANDNANHVFTNSCAVCEWAQGFTDAHRMTGNVWKYGATTHWTENTCTGSVVGVGCNFKVYGEPEYHGACLTPCVCGYTPGHLGNTNTTTSATNKMCSVCANTITGTVTTKTCDRCNGTIKSYVDWDSHECDCGELGGTVIVTVSVAPPATDGLDTDVLGYHKGESGSFTTDNVFFSFSGGATTAGDLDAEYDGISYVSFSGGWVKVAKSGWYALQVGGDDTGQVQVGGNAATFETYTRPGKAVVFYLSAGVKYPVSGQVENSEFGPTGLYYVKKLEYVGATKPTGN